MATDPTPTYHVVKTALLEDIGRGLYVPGHRFITQREVCSRFGVSHITAERALNDLVRDGVLTRRRGVGTFVATPVAAPRSERAGETRLIAFVANFTHSKHIMAIMRGAQAACRDAGYHLVLLDSTESSKAEAECLERARHAGVDGVIVYPADGFQSTAHFERLRTDGVPLVLVDRYYPGLATDVVMPDHVAVGASVTEYLIDQGHRCLATAWSDEVKCTAVHERLIGHKQALRAHDLPIDAELTALRPYSAQPAERRRQILSVWLERPNPPTAVIAVHSEVLAVVISDLAALGVQVGKEIALACMDSIDAEGLPTLAVAGVIVPSYEMGVRAMQVLLGRVRGVAAPPEQVLLPVELAVSRALPLAGTQLRTVRRGDGRGSDRQLVAERR